MMHAFSHSINSSDQSNPESSISLAGLRSNGIEFLKLSDYSQLFNRSRKKLHKDKIDKDVRELLRSDPGQIVSNFYFAFTVYSKIINCYYISDP